MFTSASTARNSLAGVVLTMFPNFHTAPTNPPQSTPDGTSTPYVCNKTDENGYCACDYVCCSLEPGGDDCTRFRCDYCSLTRVLAVQPPVWGVKTVVTSETPPRYLTELTFGKLTVLMTPEACQQLGVTLIEAGYHCSHIEQVGTPTQGE